MEIMKFVSDNDLLYIGESSALADINIKEVVEALMESKIKLIALIFHRNSRSIVKRIREESIKVYEAKR